MKKALVFLANGFEEIEALTPVDYLRRAGVEVITVATGTSNRTVESARKIPVVADMTLDAWLSSLAELPDMVVAPGGGNGAKNISECAAALSLIDQMFDAGKFVAAICASPAVVLSKTKVLEGKKWTCYPGEEEKAPEYKASKIDSVPFVTDGTVITGCSAGTAQKFAMELIRVLCGEDAAEKVRQATVQI